MKVDKIFLPVFDALKKAVKEANKFEADMKRISEMDWTLESKKENYMEKCKWKDGKFEPCKGYSGTLRDYPLDDALLKVCSGVYAIHFCPWCGADICKPEPEQPIIKKSGETWVARYEGVDYLFVGTVLSILGYKQPPNFDYFEKSLMGTGWKPISEIEITDEIAKLRPMVIDGGSIEKLYAVDNETFVTDEDRTSDLTYRLATILDLED